MTRKGKKYTLIIVLFIVLLAGAVGYYLYNKGPKDVQNSSSIETTATILYNEFSKDSTIALKKYADKILTVTGEVVSVTLNQKKEKIILLKTNTGGASINCTMEEDIVGVKPNDKVNIKGICSGIGQGDEDLGIKADVYLTRCFLIK